MHFLYIFLQCTWGIFQTLLGLVYLIREGRGKEHFWFHGAYVTKWDHDGGISLGMFLFVGNMITENGPENAYLTHEYGHSIQSLILGPLYLPVIGITSSSWAAKYNGEMLRQGISYFSVFPENNANTLGQKITGIKVPENVPEEMFELQDAFPLKIGGVEQWISYRGTSKDNPVLLVIHGGPGSTLTGLSHIYQRPWEKYYTVVNWDQRCSGKTASVSGKTSPVEITIDMMVNDALEVTDYLRKLFNKDKIIILGHSWGTILGAHLAMKYPERYIAYISTGTVVNSRGQEKFLSEYFTKKFEETGETKKLEKVKALGQYWEDETIDQEKTLAMNRIVIEEGHSSVKAAGVIGALKYEIIPMLKSPEYSLKDSLNIFGYKAYSHIIEKEMPDFNAEKLGCDYQIPVYYINGDKDLQTPYPLAEEYFKKTIAPDKEFFTLNNCAHCWDLDAPEQMAEVMCEKLPQRIKNFS